MKRSALVLVVVCLLGVSSGSSDVVPPLDADRLLEEVVARLPREALMVKGEMIVRRRHGMPVGSLGFEMRLDWGGLPATATYTIFDAFGRSLEQLTVFREEGASPRFRYAAGDPLQPEEVPPLFDKIRSSDISWADLSLAFLWWRGGEVTGAAEVRGRKCYVVEVPAPETGTAGGTGAPGEGAAPYAAVRLWIDEELLMLLQAEGLNAARGPVRKLWVKSFKKIDDRWMIKDMEVQSYPVQHRTKLTVREVSAAAPL